MNPFHHNLPLTPGLHDGGTSEHVDPVQQKRLRIEQLKALHELTSEYAFYTPAIVHLKGRLTFDPLTDFIRDYGKAVDSLTMRFDKQIFQGLQLPDDPAWNFVLFAMPHETWPHYLNWLSGITLLDRDQQLLIRIRNTELQISDPLYLQHKAVIEPSQVPLIPVNGLGLETNRGSYYLSKPIDPLWEMPRGQWTTRTYADTCRQAQALLQGERYVEDTPLPDAPPLQLPTPIAWQDLPESKRRELETAFRQLGLKGTA